MKAWRNKPNKETKDVLVWMIANDVTAADVARDYGVKDSAVSHFLYGRMPSSGLRQHFIDIGCPKRLMTGIDRLRKRVQTKRAA